MSNLVAVVDEWSASEVGDVAIVVARFDSVKEAEEYIGSLPNEDEVFEGRYGIDAPEWLVNGCAPVMTRPDGVGIYFDEDPHWVFKDNYYSDSPDGEI